MESTVSSLYSHTEVCGFNHDSTINMNNNDMRMMEDRISYWETHGEVLDRAGANQFRDMEFRNTSVSDNISTSDVWSDHIFGIEIWEDLE